MFSMYINPIIIGIVMTLMIVFFTIIPILIYQYRKYGAIRKVHLLIKYSFILYLICAYLLVILPLPSRSEVAQLTTPYYNIIPFDFVRSMIEDSGFVWNNPETYLAALKSGSVFTVLFNILLMLPLGIYFREYFHYSLRKTVFIGFLISLFFEISQLTGLFWIYPRPYRMFDVDDLMVNTFGVLVAGYWLSGVIDPLLPKDREVVPAKRVTFTRRMIAFLVDLIVISIVTVFAFILLNLFSLNVDEEITHTIVFFLYFIIVTWGTGGVTIGKALLNIRIVSATNQLKLRQLLVRYAILTFFIKICPLIQSYGVELNPLIGEVLGMICGILRGVFFLTIIWAVIRRKDRLIYEIASKTYQVAENKRLRNIK